MTPARKLTSPKLPLKTRFLMAALAVGLKICLRSDGTVKRSLVKLLEPKAFPSKSSRSSVITTDVFIDKTRNLWFRIFTPTSAAACDGGERLPVILYFHGGGFALFGPDTKAYDDLCRRLALEVSVVVFSVNYRLAPEHRCPCQYEDGFDALKFIDSMKLDDSLARNADLKRCFLAGDSAGGNLAHHMAVKASEYEFRNLSVAGLIAIQPFFGGEERTESEKKFANGLGLTVENSDWYWKAFLPDGSDRDDPAVNVVGPKSADISRLNFPATMVIVGGFDPLQDWQKKYHEELKKSGKEAYLVEYENMTHSFYAFPEVQESSFMIQEIRGFMQKQLPKLAD